MFYVIEPKPVNCVNVPKSMYRIDKDVSQHHKTLCDKVEKHVI